MKRPLGQLQKKGSEADRTAASRQTHGREGSWESLETDLMLERAGGPSWVG